MSWESACSVAQWDIMCSGKALQVKVALEERSCYQQIQLEASDSLETITGEKLGYFSGTKLALWPDFGSEEAEFP